LCAEYLLKQGIIFRYLKVAEGGVVHPVRRESAAAFEKGGFIAKPQCMPTTFGVALLKMLARAIKKPTAFRAGWIVLLPLHVGFLFWHRCPVVSAITATSAAVLFAMAKRGHTINQYRGRPARCAIADHYFSLGLYLAVYGSRDADF